MTCNALCAMQIITYIRCVTTDPGIIKEGMKAPIHGHLREKIEYCDKYSKETWKPKRAHYCSALGVYVFKMDHHCPWINNCVGQRNQKYFMQLNFYTMLASLMQFFCMAHAFLNLLIDHRARRHFRHPVSSSPINNLTCSIVVLLCVLRLFSCNDLRRILCIHLLWAVEWTNYDHGRQSKLRWWFKTSIWKAIKPLETSQVDPRWWLALVAAPNPPRDLGKLLRKRMAKEAS